MKIRTLYKGTHKTLYAVVILIFTVPVTGFTQVDTDSTHTSHIEYVFKAFHRLGSPPMSRLKSSNSFNYGINGMDIGIKRRSYELGLGYQIGDRFYTIQPTQSNLALIELVNGSNLSVYFNYHIMPLITKKQLNRFELYGSLRTGAWIPHSSEGFFPEKTPQWHSAAGLGLTVFITRRFGIFSEYLHDIGFSNNMYSNYFHVGLIYSIR